MDTSSKHLESGIVFQTPTLQSSADRLAQYLLDSERNNFEEGVGGFVKEDFPHIFAYVIDQRVERGVATPITQDMYDELDRLNWLPASPFAVHTNDPESYYDLLIVPPTASSDYDSDQYTR